MTELKMEKRRNLAQDKGRFAGVKKVISAAGFLHHELSIKGNCGRCHDGRDINGTYISWILRAAS